MANHEQQDGSEATPVAAPAIPPLTPRGASRRRIAGLGVSGVLMTVASNHAMAGLVCKSPSGALSGNLNSHRPNVTCNGVSPGYWKTHPSSWPSEVKTSDAFSKYFTCWNALSTMSCMKVLSKQTADKNAVAMHIMATYLNVCSGRITFLTRQKVIDIWAKYNRDGTYTPADGALPWSGKQLVDYLASTMG
jgi:hypothetical protein